MANRRGKSKITVDGDCSHEIRRCLFLGREAMTKLGSVLKSKDFSVQCTAAKGQYSQGYGLPSGHVLWELDLKEGRRPKNWCLGTVVLEKTPESPLDSKEIKSINLKGERPWIFTGRTDAKAEASVFWSSDEKSQLTGKVPDAGKDWGQKEKRVSEDEIAGQHHQCNERELGQTPRDGGGHGTLVCCSPCSRKELDMTERLNNNNN